MADKRDEGEPLVLCEMSSGGSLSTQMRLSHPRSPVLKLRPI
jgi:hypothetical protein